MRLTKSPASKDQTRPPGRSFNQFASNSRPKAGVFSEPIINKFWQKNKTIFIVFLLWRSSLTLFEWVGLQLLPFKVSFPYANTTLMEGNLPEMVRAWGNFDGVHYLIIAQRGYLAAVAVQVFFPFYPIIIHLVSWLLNGDYIWSGILISNASFLGALFLFRNLLQKYFPPKIVTWSLIFLCFFPSSFFFGAIYTESIFLFLVLASFLNVRYLSAIATFLAATTRLVGVFLTPALFWAKDRLTALAGAIGLAVYMVYLQIVFHNPLYFLTGQKEFANNRASSLTTLITPPQVIWRYLKIFATGAFGSYDFWIAVSEFGFFVFAAVVLAILTWKKKVPAPWLIFAWFAFLLPSFSGTFSSEARYLLVVFPIFVGLAMIPNKIVKIVILVFFIVLLALSTALFTRGYWIA